MTNREKYKQAFAAVHAPEDLFWEVKQMEKTARHHRLKTAAIAAAICAALFGSASAAYAADVGGIQSTVQIWIHGAQTTADITFDGSGGYTLDYVDETGTVQTQGGAGVSHDDGGTRPLTDEELTEILLNDTPQVEYLSDGTVWIYWYDQALDITDMFEDGVCYVKLTHDGETLYVTVKDGAGYGSSSDDYPDPDTWS